MYLGRTCSLSVLTLAMAVAFCNGGSIIPRLPAAAEVECDYSGRIVEVLTDGCGVAPFECGIEIKFVPSISHEILSIRISTIQGDTATPVIDQPIRDSAVVGGVQYTFGLTVSPPLNTWVRLELHGAGNILEVCTIVDNS